jgi:peptide-methionine (S)-S-oxide reductase
MSPARPVRRWEHWSDFNKETEMVATQATATFAGGCFWCTEAVFQQLQGVEQVVSGYCGGETENPTYQQVCSGRTGHAEAIRITFDPQQVSFDELLEVFFQTHDPTTLNRQGNDVGTQYRSAVFYHDDDQHRAAAAMIRALDEAGTFSGPIVTTLEPAGQFYSAEDYHQNYFRENPRQPYCLMVVAPKVEKFQQRYSAKLKES